MDRAGKFKTVNPSAIKQWSCKILLHVPSPQKLIGFSSNLFYRSVWVTLNHFDLWNSLLFPLVLWKIWFKFTHQTETVKNNRVWNWFDTLEQERKATHLNSINFGCRCSLEGCIQVMSNPNMYCVGLLCLFDLYSVWPQILLNLELLFCSLKLGNVFLIT